MSFRGGNIICTYGEQVKLEDCPRGSMGNVARMYRWDVSFTRRTWSQVAPWDSGVSLTGMYNTRRRPVSFTGTAIGAVLLFSSTSCISPSGSTVAEALNTAPLGQMKLSEGRWKT